MIFSPIFTSFSSIASQKQNPKFDVKPKKKCHGKNCHHLDDSKKWTQKNAVEKTLMFHWWCFKRQKNVIINGLRSTFSPIQHHLFLSCLFSLLSIAKWFCYCCCWYFRWSSAHIHARMHTNTINPIKATSPAPCLIAATVALSMHFGRCGQFYMCTSSAESEALVYEMKTTRKWNCKWVNYVLHHTHFHRIPSTFFSAAACVAMAAFLSNFFPHHYVYPYSIK